ncbi:recombinase family protein [Clostridiaceae bacterium M8S5]|nr:recombinase family protein [Clostridiaceae bacterium M8S5]
MKNDKKWKVAIYLRLSKDDGDKSESQSITNQRQIIESYLNGKDEFVVVSTKIDDGYTGSNFERPAFKEMMEEVKDKKVDCIIVKDLSRFGREHIKSSEYIEKIFPVIGVRFIAVNDGYDSQYIKDSDNLIIPFKNLINDSVCRDISIKTRTTLKVKRENAEYVSPFTPYGYKKSEENRNRIVVDEDVRDIIKDIFAWKIQGMSAYTISAKLNELGILSPMEYKLSKGQNFSTGFRTHEKAMWSPKAVIRVLKNPIFKGVLIQGRFTTPNHKVKKIIVKPKEEWAIIENNHEAIIPQNEFDLVQSLMKLDTKTAPYKNKVYLFSGLIYCGKCKESMSRKTSHSHNKRYTYYLCSAKKYPERYDYTCTMNNISDIALEQAVFNIIYKRIQEVIDMDKFINDMDKLSLQEKESKKLQAQIKSKTKELDKCNKIYLSLYENYILKLIDKEEYEYMRKLYSTKIEKLKKQLELQKQEQQKTLEGNTLKTEWIEEFKQYKNITELDRGIVVFMIKRIEVYEDKTIKIIFNHADEYKEMMNNISNDNAIELTPEEEEVILNGKKNEKSEQE